MARVNLDAAERLLDGLVSDMRSLAFMPCRNPVYDRPFLSGMTYRYMLSCGRYRIVFQIEGRTVIIYDIQDCRQSDIKSILPKK
ncbi:MAG: type II toxin-antitoxin system RelE/ParE family toxin [Oscillospiraceae bacterium]|nr:type II toxin-antitoxin system RelE/ParE family toxin [Oscillospiraceae bacterium]